MKGRIRNRKKKKCNVINTRNIFMLAIFYAPKGNMIQQCTFKAFSNCSNFNEGILETLLIKNYLIDVNTSLVFYYLK